MYRESCFCSQLLRLASKQDSSKGGTLLQHSVNDYEKFSGKGNNGFFYPFLLPDSYNTTQSKIDGDLWKFFYFLFARHNTGDFPKCQKWTQKNRKPFLDFQSWCAILCNGGYSVLMYVCSSKRNLNRAAASSPLVRIIV